jgi:hypothetical protein
MERSASAHLENDQGARLPWLRLLAPAGKSSVFARFDLLPDFLSICLFEKRQLCYRGFTPFR